MLKWLKSIGKPKRFKREFRSETCLNCQHMIDVSDQYCSNCGQRNSNKKLSLSDLIKELLASIFSYDSRLRKTIGAIFTRPGKISLEYTHGKRIKYVNPFRFFISIAIIFFLVLTWLIPKEEIQKQVNETNKEFLIKPNDSIAKSIAKQKSKKFNFQKTSRYIKYSGLSSYDSIRTQLGFEDSMTNQLKVKLINGSFKLEKSPSDFITYILPKLPFFLFGFIPIFSLFSWLFYLRRKFTYVDHLIFNFHETSVFFLLLLLEISINFMVNNDSASFNSISIYLFIIYHIMASMYFYKQGFFKTLVKCFLLAFLYIITCLLFVVSLISASLMFY
ncbi:DUF3667 domain-containing protein [Psychroflexus sp. ALD_RP9]|uniref:DUF3667 domain-containing protein n=1 Tax=Psychroflexus sp. ALD_RP9 TaxID=2777186 RepID=UPI001A90685D|nr:DUF3667 domain-containing protein [Psychroflexus sp. ALD_RP9]QSS96049.1 DUF3667 domain-containing protein [Psychroflexus sp. ALD_RP9]